MKNSILEQHQAALIAKDYTGVTTRFSGYIQFSQIHDENHNTIGFTSDFFKKCVEMVSHPNYCYSRQKNGYINIYITDSTSPTGVSLLGGIPDEFEYLLSSFGKTGQLSPTEDLRTAH